MLSDNSKAVFNYIKGFVGQEPSLTPVSIAEATGLVAKNVGGILLSFQKKGLIERTQKVVNEKVVNYVVPQATMNTYDPDAQSLSDQSKGKKVYSDNTKAIGKLLQGKVGTDEKFSASDIAEALNLTVQSVNGTLTGFQKKGYIVRGDKKAVQVGEEVKEVRYITVNPSIKEEAF